MEKWLIRPSKKTSKSVTLFDFLSVNHKRILMVTPAEGRNSYINAVVVSVSLNKLYSILFVAYHYVIENKSINLGFMIS